MRAPALAALLLAAAAAAPALADGGVTATLEGRRLVVRGDDAANTVEIRAGGATDEVVVAGTSTTVNGAASETFADVRSIEVDMGAGDDRVDVKTLKVRGELLVRGGDGNDQAYVTGCTVRLRTSLRGGAGTDTLRIDGSSRLLGSVLLRGEAGNDEIQLVGATFLGRVRADGGDDDDHVLLQAAKPGPLARVEVATRRGRDSVELLSSQFQNDVHVDAGSDDDRVRVASCQFLLDCEIFGGAGVYDVLALESGNTYGRIRVFDGFEEGQP